jgi:hypothetical protein
MLSETFRQFLRLLAALITAGFAIAAAVTPPDPYSQLRALTVILPTALVGAYLLAYRGGYTGRRND